MTAVGFKTHYIPHFEGIVGRSRIPSRAGEMNVFTAILMGYVNIFKIHGNPKLFSMNSNANVLGKMN